MSNTGVLGAIHALDSSFEMLCHSLERAFPHMASEISTIRDISNRMRDSTRDLVVTQTLSGYGPRGNVVRDLGRAGLLSVPANEIYQWMEDRIPHVLCENTREVTNELDFIASQLRIVSLDSCNATMRWTPRNPDDVGRLFVDRNLGAVQGHELTYRQGIYRGRIGEQVYGRDEPQGHTLALRLMDSNHSLLLFDDRGATRVYTYVPMEEQWIEHQDMRYLAPGTIRMAFQHLAAEHGWAMDTKQSLAEVCKAIQDTLIDFAIPTSDKDLPMPHGYDFQHHQRFDPWVFSYTQRLDHDRGITRRVYRVGLGSNVLSITDHGENRYEFDAFAQVLKTRDWFTLPPRVRQQIKETFIEAVKATAAKLDLVAEPA